MASPIVGIGELLWDIFPDGRKVAGGAPFNFAFHCHQLGHEAVVVSRVGDDQLGRELRDEVKRLGLSDEHIQTDRKLPTGTVRVAVDAKGQPSYTITAPAAWDAIAWSESLADLTRDAAAICHGTLGLRAKASRNTILKAAALKSVRGKRNGLVIYDVNLRGEMVVSEDAIRLANWIKVNDTELPMLESCIDIAMDDDPWPRTQPKMFEFLRHIGAPEEQLWLVTRGEHGADLLHDAAKESVRGVRSQVVDTVGAGDAFTAAMVCLHREGKPLLECARFANRYAAKVCEHRGATPKLDRAEVDAAP